MSKKFDADGIERFAVRHSADGNEYVSMADESFKISEYVYNKDGTKSASKIYITELKPGDAVRLTLVKTDFFVTVRESTNITLWKMHSRVPQKVVHTQLHPFIWVQDMLDIIINTVACCRCIGRMLLGNTQCV